MSRSPLPTAEAVARQFLARRPAHRLPWRWDASMALVGLGHLMAVSPSARTRHLGDLQDYQTTHLRTRSIALADHCLGAQSSLFLLRWRDDAEARFATQRVVDYLRTAPENDLGVLDHLGRHAWYRRLLRPGAWVDSMMMYVVTAAKVGGGTRAFVVGADGCAPRRAVLRAPSDVDRPVQTREADAGSAGARALAAWQWLGCGVPRGAGGTIESARLGATAPGGGSVGCAGFERSVADDRRRSDERT